MLPCRCGNKSQWGGKEKSGIENICLLFEPSLLGVASPRGLLSIKTRIFLFAPLFGKSVVENETSRLFLLPIPIGEEEGEQ
jgi:hypothetical protein